ncbi:MAG: hypothetical protein ACLUDF_01930 [Butyricicoccus sp.]
MNFAIVRYLIGWLMGIESLFLLLPAFTAVIYREPELPAYIATALFVWSAQAFCVNTSRKTPSSTHAKALWQSRCAGWCWP